MTESISKIENDLLPELDAAAIKGNMQRALTALIESLRHIVEDAKATHVALAVLHNTTQQPRVDEVEKPAPTAPKKVAKPAVKKAPAKKTATTK